MVYLNKINQLHGHPTMFKLVTLWIDGQQTDFINTFQLFLKNNKHLHRKYKKSIIHKVSIFLIKWEFHI